MADPHEPSGSSIVVAFTGDPESPTAWSGTPRGLIDGLRAHGVTVSTLNVNLPPWVERTFAAAVASRYVAAAGASEGKSRLRNAYATATISPLLTMLRSRWARWRSSRLPPHDATVQIGSGFEIDGGAPIATFEDMTVKQALRYPYPHWSALGQDAIARRLAAQERLYRSSAAICMTNSWAADSAIGDYGVAPSRVHVIGVGSHFPAEDVERDFAVPRFLFVGREWERKNGASVVAAFETLRRERPDAELHLVGGHPPIETPGVAAHGVLRLGVPEERERLRELFRTATCFVMPSLLEPSAVAYAEACSLGLPIIGTSSGGSADIIGEAGLVVDPESPSALAAAMTLMADPGQAAAFAARAAARAEAVTWYAVAGRLLRALSLPTRSEPPPLGEPARVIDG